MQLRKSTPGEGGATPRRESFAYTNTAAGLKNAWTGWLACEVYWCKAHEHKPPRQIGTKPCLNWLTRGAVPCPWCRPSNPVKDIGYCHVYREVDGAPCLVLVHDSVADLACGLDYGSHVLVGRVDGTSSSFVKPTESRVPFRSNLEHRKRPLCYAESLFGIWACPALTAWAQTGSSRPVSDTALSPPTPGKPVEGWKRFVEVGSAFTMHGEVGTGETSANEAFVREVNGGARPSRNGKHKKPPGGE